MSKIEFSHEYVKMPKCAQAKLLAVFNTIKEHLKEDFIEYDTRTTTGSHYPLPEGRLIILLLHSCGEVWTTVRRWTPEKEQYYRSKIGEIFEIEISEAV